MLFLVVKEKKIITFSKIVKGLKRLEAIKTFITLLFLAQTGKIKLWHQTISDKLFITPLTGTNFEQNRTEPFE